MTNLSLFFALFYLSVLNARASISVKDVVKKISSRTWSGECFMTHPFPDTLKSVNIDLESTSNTKSVFERELRTSLMQLGLDPSTNPNQKKIDEIKDLDARIINLEKTNVPELAKVLDFFKQQRSILYDQLNQNQKEQFLSTEKKEEALQGRYRLYPKWAVGYDFNVVNDDMNIITAQEYKAYSVHHFAVNSATFKGIVSFKDINQQELFSVTEFSKDVYFSALTGGIKKNSDGNFVGQVSLGSIAGLEKPSIVEVNSQGLSSALMRGNTEANYTHVVDIRSPNNELIKKLSFPAGRSAPPTMGAYLQISNFEPLDLRYFSSRRITAGFISNSSEDFVLNGVEDEGGNRIRIRYKKAPQSLTKSAYYLVLESKAHQAAWHHNPSFNEKAFQCVLYATN